jgi:hypothetical protein
VCKDRIKKWRKVYTRVIELFHGNAFAPDSIDNRKICLFVRSTELEKEFEHLLFASRSVCCGLINFIDNNDWAKAKLERLLQHKTCLWHGTFLRVHDKEY